MSISLYPPTLALAMAGAAPGTTFGVDFKRLLELPRNLPNRLLELPNYGLWQAKSFLLSAPKLPSPLLELPRNLPNQTMGCGKPSLSFSTGPKLPDAPFKPSKRSETSKPAPGAATKPAKPALGAAKLWAVVGQVFPFKRSETSKPAPGAATKPAKPNYGLWQAKPFLFYRPETAGCSLQTLQTLRNFQTGSWSCHETCQTGSWSCQTMGCGRPSLSFKALRNFQARSWSCHETCQTKLWAVTGQVFPFLRARNCQKQTATRTTWNGHLNSHFGVKLEGIWKRVLLRILPTFKGWRKTCT